MPEDIQTPQEGTEKKEVVNPQPSPEPKDAPAPPTDPATPDEPKPAIDWERKARASASENAILRSQIETGRPRVNTNQNPTEEELRREFPDWDDRTDSERNDAIRIYRTEQRQEQLIREREAEKAERSYQASLDAVILSEPKLQGRERDFRRFAEMPTHRGAPPEVLLHAFLFREKLSDTLPGDEPPPKIGLEPGNGGSGNPAPTSTELSGDQIEAIRTTDPKRYRELIRQGKI